MPYTEKQHKLFAMAEHNPKKLRKKNKGLLKLKKAKLHEMVASGVK
jgi:hypothetical protein